MPIVLLLSLAIAFGIAAVLFIVFAGRYADRGLKLQQADETIEALQAQMEQALAQQEKLTERIQNLEAIVVGEAWDALHANPPIPLDADVQEEPPDAEKIARLAKRQRSA